MNFENIEDIDTKKDNNLVIDGFDEKSGKELTKIIKRFMDSYKLKDKSTNDREWLSCELKKELPELSDIDVKKLSDECFDEVEKFDENLKSLNQAIENGSTKESWFNKKIEEASIGMSVNDVGNYLSSIESSITKSNTQMQRVITNMNGTINQNMNLDGFMAEQYHVNSFNMNAELNKSAYRAEVQAPGVGETYGKNSFDVVIKDGSGKIAHQYQMKYGATAKDTIRMIKHGNYNNQRIVVPAEQLEEVRQAFPSKSIEASIGGTDRVKVSSGSLTKAEAKEMQLKTQQENIIPKEDWNHFKIKDLSTNIAKNAGIAGLQAAAITTGFDMARKAMSGEKIEVDETIELALKRGVDAGIKAGVTGAVKVGVEKGIVSIIPKGTPAGIIADVVCVGIENVKILEKVNSGDLTMTEGLDLMGRTTTSMVCGIEMAVQGSMIGAAALSWIPVVGPVVGSVVGGTIGYMAGSKFGEAVHKTAKKISSTAKKVASKAWEGVKSIGRGIKSLFSW
ncbi:hypothetical protein GKZ28_19835 [Clostridium chromiireducens]|uniref:Uncharacterized protein n=1 Tax=Clostridium chromiireducens TaxID=225345 RepID=A0A964W484_9CLOT|nr:hypothetical protein [Clostridium chromiireducens]MVX65933.1 hypothetical protein [Clostridium chromiireducens]